MERRDFLVNTGFFVGALTVSSCSTLVQYTQPRLNRGIDIHAHIFNARDLSVVGFLEQVILRDSHQPFEESFFRTGGLELLYEIMLFVGRTPSAESELNSIERNQSRSALRKEAGDLEAVRTALQRFRNKGQRESRRNFTDGPSQNEARYNDIAREVGLGSGGGTAEFALARANPSELAARIYERRSENEYLRNSHVLQTIRWAGLLTRSRMGIVDELVSLYGKTKDGDSSVQVFSPSLVDFEAWFKKPSRIPPSSIRDQIDVMSKIAEVRTDTVLLNFVPFCPLRAALELEDDPTANILGNVQYAIEKKGFAGVKLYPPLGFRALGNSEVQITDVFRKPKGGGAALDYTLNALYGWCNKNEVPIKAHANNSIARSECSAVNASPRNWEKVLSTYPKIRVNLAHFGGFEESLAADDPCVDESMDWEETISELIATHDNLYFDTGYWMEIADPKSEIRDQVRAKTLKFLNTGSIEHKNKLRQRIMYGSDWSMIGREPAHPEYVAQVNTQLIEMGLSAKTIDNFFGNNARKFLGLDDRRSQQYQRLGKFFRGHSGFDHVFG